MFPDFYQINQINMHLHDDWFYSYHTFFQDLLILRILSSYTAPLCQKPFRPPAMLFGNVPHGLCGASKVLSFREASGVTLAEELLRWNPRLLLSVSISCLDSGLS